MGPRVGVFSQTLSVAVEGLKSEGFRRKAKESKKLLALSLALKSCQKRWCGCGEKSKVGGALG
ncbi:hypothetical protein MA16_Dca006089 [Dendrobium catenatum]|uniref:Uncharacterized protein n=1 Tax=Dendrobium catenatum TaxID=906689 RepID=A0A2I0X4H1_9ASPA|nr:hypothetical protein MA16_Dca006089 [Dendrobium catenatum]